jgi:hypothetical protein
MNFLQHAPYLYPDSVPIFITDNDVHDLFDLVLPGRRDARGPSNSSALTQELPALLASNAGR